MAAFPISACTRASDTTAIAATATHMHAFLYRFGLTNCFRIILCHKCNAESLRYIEETPASMRVFCSNSFLTFVPGLKIYARSTFMKRPALAAALFFSAVFGAAQSPVSLPASPSTVVWGYYSAKAKPVLTIHSGDTVRIQTLSTCGPTERLVELGVAPSDIP